MRSYPIWIDTNNPSYAGNKSQGVRSYANNFVSIGSSRSNSFDFLNHSIKCIDEGAKRIFHFFLDGQLVKSAEYNKNKKVMSITSTEDLLKKEYFQKWKDEEAEKEQQFRNERLAERDRLNNGYTKGGH